MFKIIITTMLFVSAFARAESLYCPAREDAFYCANHEALKTAEFYYNDLLESIQKKESAELVCQKIGRVQGAFAALDSVTNYLPSRKQKGRPVYMEPLIGIQGFCEKSEESGAIPWVKYGDVNSLLATLNGNVNGTAKDQLEAVRRRLEEDFFRKK